MNKELPAGSTLSHYRIASKIGAGGMGEVYLAQDTRLDRKVALKILPPNLAANQDRMRRFVQEAKAAATLNHPNIAHIYEIGESDGVNFIAMEFIEGATLREKIHQQQTDLRKLLRYLQHVAEGLAKAHTAGIVHRDLKPDNIMITLDGHAKIVDFGLAKLLEQHPLPNSDSSEVATAMMHQHSIPGAIMGTVGYMSPEQALGKTNEIDQRSDIFSFGCILYEAVTGHKAFEGKDAVDSLNKIIREPAAPVATFNPDAPPDLQRIIRRCLAKEADERYQTIKDVAIELKEVRRELQGADSHTTAPASRATAASDGSKSAHQSARHGSGAGRARGWNRRARLLLLRAHRQVINQFGGGDAIRQR
jgi:serine/threonine protein kinase